MLRKTFTFLILALFMFVGNNVVGQITEIGTVDTRLTYSPYDDVLHNFHTYYNRSEEYIYDEESDEWIATGKITEGGDCKVRLYKTDLTLIKVVDFMPTFKSLVKQLSELGMDVLCVGKNLYTNSGKYEFLLSGYVKNDKGDDARISGIYNEDGELVYSLPNIRFRDQEVFASPFIKDGTLVIHTYDTVGYDEKYGYPITEDITKAYKLSGSKAASITNLPMQQQSKLYPNPARQSVTLEYDIQGQMQQMQIIDMQGRTVENYLLDPTQKQVKINTSNYKKGVYIYRYGNQSGKFVVK